MSNTLSINVGCPVNLRVKSITAIEDYELTIS
jgi:hypothetical protein